MNTVAMESQIITGPGVFGRANAITLSCKNRLTCLAQEAARRLPRPTRSGRSELQPPCRARAVRVARGAPPPGQRTGGFCQLVRTVGLRHELLWPLAKVSTGALSSKHALRGSGRRRLPPLCRTELQKTTLPALLPSRCRGRLFDANPEERGACGGLPPLRPCVWLARSSVCLRFSRTGIA